MDFSSIFVITVQTYSSLKGKGVKQNVQTWEVKYYQQVSLHLQFKLYPK